MYAHVTEISNMFMRLTESDLEFLVEAVATERRDHDRVIELVRDKEDFLEQMLEDPKLIDHLRKDDESLLRISPCMLFSVLLREVRRQVEKQRYIYEPETRGRRIAVFEGPAIVRLLSDQNLREYLVGLLCSFVKTNVGVIHWREHGTWRRRRFDDTDMDDMIALAQLVDPQLQPRYYQRIGDIALFLSGIFPERAIRLSTRTRSMLVTRRSLQDYEQEGRRFYGMAAQSLGESALLVALNELAEKFVVARGALNFLSETLLRQQKTKLFESKVATE
jgi:hypothetical protein